MSTQSFSSMPKLLTVVLLCRERVDFIAEAVASLAEQELNDRVEFIFYDSSKTDAVRNALSSLKTPEHRYVSAGQSNIANVNWQEALCLAETPFVLCIHDDDVLVPGGLNHLVAGLDRFPDADIVFSPARSFGASDRPLFSGVFPSVPTELTRDRAKRLDLILGDKLMTTVIGCAIRTEKLRALEIPRETDPIYDLFFSAAVGLSDWAVYSIPETVGKWRISDKQQSHTWHKWGPQTVGIYKGAQAVLPSSRKSASSVSRRLLILRLRLVRIGVLRKDKSVFSSLKSKPHLVEIATTALRKLTN
jgi:glycosyltransferase involved in cell wall biosynthesis